MWIFVCKPKKSDYNSGTYLCHLSASSALAGDHWGGTNKSAKEMERMCVIVIGNSKRHKNGVDKQLPAPIASIRQRSRRDRERTEIFLASVCVPLR